MNVEWARKGKRKIDRERTQIATDIQRKITRLKEEKTCASMSECVGERKKERKTREDEEKVGRRNINPPIKFVGVAFVSRAMFLELIACIQNKLRRTYSHTRTHAVTHTHTCKNPHTYAARVKVTEGDV